MIGWIRKKKCARFMLTGKIFKNDGQERFKHKF